MKIKPKLISLSITIILMIIGGIIQFSTNNKTRMQNTVKLKEVSSYHEITIEDKIVLNIEENYDTYLFYSKMFGISMDNLKKEIINTNKESFNVYDLSNNGTCYETLDISLLHFLENLEETKPKLFNRKYQYKKVNKKYIYGLIDYFSSIYDNVDAKTLKAIAYLESGNLSASSMMLKNNIFGGMASRGLIKYPSIEYGVYRYVLLMSKSYYGKGLTTVETIGKKYNPVTVGNRQIANPSWVAQVKNFISKFENNTSLTLETLKEMEG